MGTERICMRIFTAAFFIIAKLRKKAKRPYTKIDNLWNMHKIYNIHMYDKNVQTLAVQNNKNKSYIIFTVRIQP